MQRKLRQRWFASFQQTLIDGSQFFEENAACVSIADYVMHDDDQQMVAMRELQNPRPQRQLFREINQPAPLLLGKFKSSLLTSICMKLAQILKLDGNFWIGLGNLHRFIKSRLNARAKDLVPSAHLTERSL